MNAIAARKPTLVSLAWPIFVEQGLRVLIGTVDVFMISHISDEAVAGLGVANQVVILGLILFNFIGIGSSVVITHHLGGGDRQGADRTAAAAIAVNTWIGLAISLLVFGAAAPILGFLQLPAPLMQYAVPFLTIMGGSLFVESMNIAISSVLRAHTHTRDAMLVAVFQNVLNVVGNCLLLFGLFGLPKLGVVGVALSGVGSRLAACIALWILLYRRTHLKVRLKNYLTFPRERLRSILRIGLPAAGENVSWWLAFMVVTTFSARMGEQSLATQSYTMQIVTWVILFSTSIGMGTEIMTGHLVGAGAFEDAYKSLLKNLRLAFILVTIVIVLLAVSAPLFFGLFTKDPFIVATGVLLLRMDVLLEPGRVFNIVVINSLRATGDARFPVFVGICSMWGLWVPLAWLLGLKLGLGLPGIWIAMTCDEWLRGMLMYRRWKKRRWLKHAERSRARVREETAKAAAQPAENA